jgi:predicted 3-demethylubiquinone-9 3-methyltransferase (glyoxalase superfamily)
MEITTCLWFDDRAREAANYYVDTFPGGKLKDNWITPVETPGNAPETEVTVDFEIFGQKFIALNGGPQFPHSEAVSFVIPCKDQAEVDHYWDKLINDGGSPSQCGWLKDKFGVSWQVVPNEMGKYLGGADPEGAMRAVQAMLGMTRLVVADLKAAYEGN